MDAAIQKDKEKSFGLGNSISSRWNWTGKQCQNHWWHSARLKLAINGL